MLVHGLGEHIGRCAHVADHLTAQGWDVRGFDQRGHGRSGGRRGDIAQPDSLLRDLGAFIDEGRRTDAGRQVPALLMWSGQHRCVSPVGAQQLSQA